MPNKFVTTSYICTWRDNLIIQPLADIIQSSCCRNQCYLGQLEIYTMYQQYHSVTMSAVSNTVLVMYKAELYSTKRE